MGRLTLLGSGPSSHTLGNVLIDRTAGSAIGNMTTAGGLAAGFDGVTTQVATACAGAGTDPCYIGRTLASPKKFGQAIIYGASDEGFSVADNHQITITAYGKAGAAPTTDTDGTAIGSVVFTDTANESGGRTITSTDTTNLYDHIFVNITIAVVTGVVRCAELVLYEWA